MGSKVYERISVLLQPYDMKISHSKNLRSLLLYLEALLNKAFFEDFESTGFKRMREEFSKFCDRKMNEIVAMLGWNRAWPEPLLQAFFGASKIYMEDMDGERAKKLVPSMVRIMITPGFYVYGNVVKCKVICRYSNNVDSSLIDKGLTSSSP
ncbi:hypothetical protein Godav_024643 [Gossypium davidsonii]|nr:hypothetical protein [Gossypium davidsonii]MBA0636051.1 hypothetical protein [Gossypium davidsonii]MBA0637022.1 hypothetical protein [Gossypium davidsonii]